MYKRVFLKYISPPGVVNVESSPILIIGSVAALTPGLRMLARLIPCNMAATSHDSGNEGTGQDAGGRMKNKHADVGDEMLRLGLAGVTPSHTRTHPCTH